MLKLCVCRASWFPLTTSTLSCKMCRDKRPTLLTLARKKKKKSNKTGLGLEDGPHGRRHVFGLQVPQLAKRASERKSISRIRVK